MKKKKKPEPDAVSLTEHIGAVLKVEEKCMHSVPLACFPGREEVNRRVQPNGLPNTFENKIRNPTDPLDPENWGNSSQLHLMVTSQQARNLIWYQSSPAS